MYLGVHSKKEYVFAVACQYTYGEIGFITSEPQNQKGLFHKRSITFVGFSVEQASEHLSISP